MDYSPYRLKNFYDVKKKGKLRANHNDDRPAVVLQKNQEKMQESTRFNEHSSYVDDYDNPVSLSEQNIQPQNLSHIPLNEQTKPVSFVYNDSPKSTTDTPKKIKDKTAFYVTFLIIFCFALVILSCEIIGGGIVFNELKSIFNKNYDCTYYLVTTVAYDTKIDAEKQSIKVKEKQGAGYIYAENNEYYVAIATYLDKKSAEAVVKKNEGSQIVEIVINKPPYGELNQSEYEYLVYVNDRFKTFINSLYETSLLQNSSNLVAIATKLRNEVLGLKEEILLSGIEKGLRDSLIKKVNPLFDFLELTVLQEKHENIFQAIRYANCLAIEALLEG